MRSSSSKDPFTRAREAKGRGKGPGKALPRNKEGTGSNRQRSGTMQEGKGQGDTRLVVQEDGTIDHTEEGLVLVLDTAECGQEAEPNCNDH